MPRWRTMIEPALHQLAVAGLDAEALADAVAAVLGAGACLLVGHGLLVLPGRRSRRRPSPASTASAVSAAAAASGGGLGAGGAPPRLRRCLGLGGGRGRLGLAVLRARLRGRAASRPLRGGSRCGGGSGQLGGERLVGGGLLGGGLRGGLGGGLRSCLSTFACSLAALRPAQAMSAMRRTVRSARWPCLTRVRALGLYLKTTILSPRSWRRTLALTRAPSTTGWPTAACVAVGDEEDAVEVDGLARLDVQPIDLDLAAELDAILLAAGFDDCVHGPLMVKTGESASGGTANRRGGRGQGWYPETAGPVNRGGLHHRSISRPAPRVPGHGGGAVDSRTTSSVSSTRRVGGCCGSSSMLMSRRTAARPISRSG